MYDAINKSRIVKDTFILNIRMFFIKGISLYKSRLVLYVFGIGDYGIYSIVGRIVTLFIFFNSTMASTTQRFLAL